jgi:hypothetical protein
MSCEQSGSCEEGTIRGGNAGERAVAVAGLLAELGVQRVKVGGEEFRARVTDLPGEILRRGGVVRVDVLGLEIEMAATTATWRTTRSETAGAIRSLTEAAE